MRFSVVVASVFCASAASASSVLSGADKAVDLSQLQRSLSKPVAVDATTALENFKATPPAQEEEQGDRKLGVTTGNSPLRKKVDENLRIDFFSDVVAPASFRNLLKTHPDFAQNINQHGTVVETKKEIPPKAQVNKHDGFFLDVAAPALLAGKAKGDDHRQLQGSPQCFQVDDGSVACVVEGFPGNNFLIIFFNCPTTAGATVLDCQSCTIVAEDSLEDLDANDPVCSSCQICADTIALDCSNIAGGACSVQNCAGQCVGGGPTPPTGPPPTPAPVPASQVQCFLLEDDSVACVIEGVPGENFLTIFFNCPTTAGATVLDCGSCTIVAEASFEDLDANDPTCTSCQICESTIALDCSNIATGECSVQNCGGQCVGGGGGPPPTPFPTPSGPGPTPFPTPTVSTTPQPQGPPQGFGFPTDAPTSAAARMAASWISLVVLGLAGWWA